MGIFGRNKTKTGNASSSGGSPANVGAPAQAASAPKQPPKPRLSNEEQQRLQDYPKVQKQLRELEKKVKFQNGELQEQDEYLRKSVAQLSDSEKERTYLRSEIQEQDDHVRLVTSNFAELTRQKKFQDNEMQEQDDHVRRLTKSYAELTRQKKFQDNEMQEQDDHVRRLTENYSELTRQKKFQDNEMQEQDDHVRRLTESYAELTRQKKFQDNEMQEQDDHVRVLTENYAELTRQKQFQDKEMQEQDDQVRMLTENYAEVIRLRDAQEQEIKDQEAHVRKLTEDFHAMTRQNETTLLELKSEQEQLSMLNKQNAALGEEIAAHERSLKAAETRLEDLQTELIETQRMLSLDASELRTKTAELTTSNRQKQELLSLIKDRERELNEQKQLLNESLPYLELSPQGIIQSSNRAMERVSGYSAEELVGRSERFTLQFKQEDSVRYENLWSRVVEGFSQKGKFTLYSREGQETHIEAEYLPILDQYGQVVKVVKWIRETGDRFEHSETLQAQSRGMDDLMPVLRFDMHGKIESVNDHLAKLLGSTEEHLVQLRIQELLFSHDRQSREWMDLWELFRSGESVIRNIEFKSMQTDSLRIRGSFQPIRDLRNNVVSILLVGREIDPVGETKNQSDLRPLLNFLQSMNSPQDLERQSDGMPMGAEGMHQLWTELNRIYHVDKSESNVKEIWRTAYDWDSDNQPKSRTSRYLNADSRSNGRRQDLNLSVPRNKKVKY